MHSDHHMRTHDAAYNWQLYAYLTDNQTGSHRTSSASMTVCAACLTVEQPLHLEDYNVLAMRSFPMCFFDSTFSTISRRLQQTDGLTINLFQLMCDATRYSCRHKLTSATPPALLRLTPQGWSSIICFPVARRQSCTTRSQEGNAHLLRSLSQGPFATSPAQLTDQVS